jgi:2'-5' RNA ligase
LRCVAPENIHLTLLFLGDVEADNVASIHELIQRAVSNVSPFVLEAGNFGVFPQRGAPRVLWIGLHESKPLKQLHANLVQELLPQRGVLCPNSDARSFQSGGFSPHLTLARIKSSDRQLAPSLHAALEKVPIKIVSPWRVESIELIQSELSSHGSKYSVLGTFELRALNKSD